MLFFNTSLQLSNKKNIHVVDLKNALQISAYFLLSSTGRTPKPSHKHNSCIFVYVCMAILHVDTNIIINGV